MPVCIDSYDSCGQGILASEGMVLCAEVQRKPVSRFVSPQEELCRAIPDSMSSSSRCASGP